MDVSAYDISAYDVSAMDISDKDVSDNGRFGQIYKLNKKINLKLVIHLNNFPYQTITCNKIIGFPDYLYYN